MLKCNDDERHEDETELEVQISESIEASKRKSEKENKGNKRGKEETSNVEKRMLELNLTPATQDSTSTKQMIEGAKSSCEEKIRIKLNRIRKMQNCSS